MIDIKHTEDGDIDLSGDLRYIESTGQHQRDILLAAQGHFKESPKVGADSFKYINDTDPGNYLRSVRKQLEQDKMRVDNIYFDPSGMMVIEGEYENS